MQRLIHLSKFVCKSTILVRKVNVCNFRHLYSSKQLGIDNFIAERQQIETQFGSMKDNFMDRMKQNVEKDDNKLADMIFSEDLKNTTFLTRTEEEFELLVNMIKRYTTQNQGIRFSSIFGPVVLRLCHTLNKPDAALEFMQSEEYGEFFQQITTYNLAANLLYRNEKYEQILQLYDHFKTKSPFQDQFPRVLTTYVMASSYKLNTEESYKVAVNILNASRDHGDSMNRRSIAFISALALKRGDAGLALEVLSLMTNFIYITIRHLRICALCDIGRIDDALMALRSRLNEDTPKRLKQKDSLILNETLLKVKENVDKLNNPEKIAEYRRIERSLQENNLIEMKSFEEIAFAIEDHKPFKSDSMNKTAELATKELQRQSDSKPRNGRRMPEPGLLLRKGLLDKIW